MIAQSNGWFGCVKYQFYRRYGVVQTENACGPRKKAWNLV